MVLLDRCQVPASNMLGKEGEVRHTTVPTRHIITLSTQGFRIAMKGLNGGRINIGISHITFTTGAQVYEKSINCVLI